MGFTTSEIGGAIPTDALVAYFRLNGNTYDESGNGYDLTNNGALPGTDRFNSPQKAFVFAGNPQHMIRNGGFSVGSEITISVWIKPTSSTGEWADVVGLGDNANDIRIGYDNISQKPAFDAWFGGATGISRSSKPIALNQWHHIVGVRSVAVWSLYVDGKLDSTNTVSSMATFDNFNLAISKHPGRYSQEYFVGSVDDIRIYRRALTETEISALFHEDGW